MTVILSILSAKGGVGKTTACANLAAALVQMGKSVIAIDGNITTPNLGMHLGVPLYPVTLHDVLSGRATLSQATYIHPSGVKVIPASLSVSAVRSSHAEKLHRTLRSLFDRKGFILIDGAAGLGKEARASMYASDGVIVVTNPELPAVTDAFKAIKLAERKGTRIAGVIVNRVAGKRYEMRLPEVQEMLGYDILGVIPEDSAVPESISSRMPVVQFKPRSKAAVGFKRAAAALLGEKYEYKPGIFEQLFGWLR
ncbi:MAG: cell division ATPase MinD [Candidatus Aenigmatarchaeota archaeon]